MQVFHLKKASNVINILFLTFRKIKKLYQRCTTRQVEGSFEMEGVKVQFLLSFLLISFTNGDIRMITPNFKAVNFAREIRGRRLNGSVIREIEVDSEGSCRLQN